MPKRAAFDVRRQISSALAGRVSGPLGRQLYRWFRDERIPSPVIAALCRLLIAFEDDEAVLRDARNVGKLLRLAWHRDQWVREPEDWAPASHSTARQLAGLSRHLLARYWVPKFMDAAWRSEGENATHEEWFIHIGQGGNMRTASGLPAPLTRLMAYHFLLAPSSCTITQALRFGQALGVGVSRPTAVAVLATRLGEGFTPEQEPFWLSVMSFLARHPAIAPGNVGPIIDYLHAQKFGGDGPAMPIPPQPGLSMSGRTPDSLLRQAMEMARERSCRRGRGQGGWRSCGLPAYDRPGGDDARLRRVVVAELLSHAELCAEGSAMRHCAGGYIRDCGAGYCAIFSLRVDEGRGLERRLTIEVDTAMWRIVQARGRFNAWPTPREEALLREWAAAAGLKVASF